MSVRRANTGFTLIEAIVVIVILAILATGVAVFMAGPINAYFNSAMRAEMADAADTALRRISRDVRLAVPNTVRVSMDAAGTTYLEFVPSLSGGQYLRDDNCFRAGVGCTSIVALADPLPNLANGSVDGLNVVIYNVNDNAAGDSSDDAPSIYAGANRASITGHAVAGGELTLSFASTTFHPSRGLSSPGQRFQVVDSPVSYVCAPVPGGGGTLRRVAGYGWSALQPTPAAGAGNLIANNISTCTISYAAGVQGNQGLLTLWLQLERNGETVSLFRQIHVDNTP